MNGNKAIKKFIKDRKTILKYLLDDENDLPKAVSNALLEKVNDLTRHIDSWKTKEA